MAVTKKNRGLQSGGAFNWFFQRISGAFLLIALLVHFWVLHFVPRGAHGEITFAIVMVRLRHPLWKTIDVLFLLFALYHAMNGVTILIHDYIQRPPLRMLLVGVLWVAALWLLVTGSITILSL